LPVESTVVRSSHLNALIESKISLYTAHLPLDAHPIFGNNVQLAKLFRVRDLKRFAQCGSVEIGYYGRLSKKLEPMELVKLTKQLTGIKPRYWFFNPRTIRVVGFCSGKGAFAVGELEKFGIDCLVTGEITHSVFHLMRETRANVIAFGHYASETFGLKALSKYLKNKLEIQTFFIDLPTGF